MAFVYCFRVAVCPRQMINMIGILLKFYSNQVAVLTGNQRRYSMHHPSEGPGGKFRVSDNDGPFVAARSRYGGDKNVHTLSLAARGRLLGKIGKLALMI